MYTNPTLTTDGQKRGKFGQIVVSAVVAMVLVGALVSQSGLIQRAHSLWVYLFSSPEAEYYKSGLAKLSTMDRASLEPALLDFTQAIALKPDYAAAYLKRSIVFRLLNSPQESMADLNKAIELDATNAEAYFERAASDAELGEIQRSMEDLDKAIELDPNYFQAFAVRGIHHKELQEWDKAIADFDKAISLKPWRINPDQEYALYVNRGLVLFVTGKLDEALADFDKTVKIFPDRGGQPYRNRGSVYLQKAQLREAVADYLKSLELEPEVDLAYVLPDFQSRLATETDASTKAEIEQLIAKVQEQSNAR